MTQSSSSQGSQGAQRDRERPETRYATSVTSFYFPLDNQIPPPPNHSAPNSSIHSLKMSKPLCSIIFQWLYSQSRDQVFNTFWCIFYIQAIRHYSANVLCYINQYTHVETIYFGTNITWSCLMVILITCWIQTC